jgi:hypothetical protein
VQHIRDGSINLRFDYLPTDPTMTLQVRDAEPKGAEAPRSSAA